MKVLQINSKVNVGSVSRITEHIGAQVIDIGGQSFIAYGREARTSLSKLIRIGSSFSVYLHALGALLFDAEGLFSYNSTKKLINHIKEINPDIIHLQNIHGHYINYPLLFHYLKRSKKPIVWTFHDCWPFTGHCSHFVSCNCEKWKSECFSCPLKNEYPSSLFADNSSKNFHRKKRLFTDLENLHIVAVSKWLANLANESFFKGSDINVIYNGIDVNVFKPTSSNLRSELGLVDKKVLLGVATAWSKAKGLEDYARLSESLDDSYRIVLIGLTKDQKDLLPDKIIKIERTTDLLQLAMFYTMADVVLNLSYAETFGLTTVEGMACGTPGIVYDRTASPELITNETGCVVEAGNINSLIKAIEMITNMGKNYYSAACIRRVNENFSRFENYQKYIELYKNILK